MGAPVISLREGRNKIIWVHELTEQAARLQTGGGTMVSAQYKTGQTARVVEVLGHEENDARVTEET